MATSACCQVLSLHIAIVQFKVDRWSSTFMETVSRDQMGRLDANSLCIPATMAARMGDKYKQMSIFAKVSMFYSEIKQLRADTLP